MELIVLRLVHILCGMVWVGSGVFAAVLLAPTLARLGPAGAPVMVALRQRGMFIFLPTMALLTILSGTRLMAIMSGGFDAAWFNSAPGATYAWSGLIAIVAFVLGLVVTRPLGARMAALGAELGHARDDAARAALGQRLARTQKWMSALSLLLTALLVASAAGMAVARYVG